MNIIASLTHRSPAKAESAIEDMSDLCRAMLDTGDDLSPIHAEIDIAKKYLKLERLRLDRRLKVSWSAPSLPRTARTPTLLLQLLLEHAVHNGVEQRSGVSDISMEIKMKDENTLAITLESAFPEEGIGTREDKAGLENVRLRLFDHYDEQAHLETTHIHDKFSVKIVHPAFGGRLDENSRS